MEYILPLVTCLRKKLRNNLRCKYLNRARFASMCLHARIRQVKQNVNHISNCKVRCQPFPPQATGPASVSLLHLCRLEIQFYCHATRELMGARARCVQIYQFVAVQSISVRHTFLFAARKDDSRYVPGNGMCQSLCARTENDEKRSVKAMPPSVVKNRKS